MNGICPVCRCLMVVTLRTLAPPPPGRRKAVPDLDGTVTRVSTGLPALDPAWGGGLVLGTVTLLAGGEGIGKSTLALWIAGTMVRDGSVALYVSGEEAETHFKDRSRRLFGDPPAYLSQLYFLETFDLRDLLDEADGVNLLVVDSTQAILDPELDAPAGGVRQAQMVTAALTCWARKRNVPVLLLNQVTKDGEAMGPRTLRHLVDVVMMLERPGNPGGYESINEPADDVRDLWTEKNRFGPAPLVTRFALGAADKTL